MHPFKWDHRINKYYLVNCAGFMLENFVWKPCKWNKKNVLFTFGSYVRIMLESSIRLTLDSYVINHVNEIKNYVVIPFGS